MAEPTKKSSPFPLERATDHEVAPRPLSPMRKLALPIGVAASLVLAGASAGAYAYASSAKSSGNDDGCSTRSHASDGMFVRAVDKLRSFVDPQPTRLAGSVMTATPAEPVQPPPVAPASASGSATPAPVPPHPDPPPLPGRRRPTTTTPTTTTPAATPITPTPDIPKLGGKPTAPSTSPI